MKIHKIAITLLVVMVMAVAAHASPIFGSWKGELNGKPITVTVTYTSGHTDVTMTSEGRSVTVSDARFPKGGPPMMLHFQAANQNGKAKLVSSGGSDLSFELETANGQEATLRVIDQGKTITTAKMVKSEAAK